MKVSLNALKKKVLRILNMRVGFVTSFYRRASLLLCLKNTMLLELEKCSYVSVGFQRKCD